MTISLDFDDVLYDLNTLNLKFIEEVYGKKIERSEITYFNYYWDKYPEIKRLWESPDMYCMGEAFEESFEFMKECRRLAPVQIVTSTMSTDVEIPKNEMIKRLFGDITVIHTKSKVEFTKNSILVDDAEKNILAHINENKCPAILFDYKEMNTWNHSFKEEEYDLVSRAISHEEALIQIERKLRSL